MNIQAITGAAPVAPAAPVARPGAEPTAAPASAAATPTHLGGVEVDPQTREPKALRFPWLSRLSRELEPVSKQPSPYGSAPALGQKLDKTA